MSGRSGHLVHRALEKGASLAHTRAFCAFDIAGTAAIASGHMPNTEHQLPGQRPGLLHAAVVHPERVQATSVGCCHVSEWGGPGFRPHS